MLRIKGLKCSKCGAFIQTGTLMQEHFSCNGVWQEFTTYVKFVIEIEECDGEYRSVIIADDGVDQWEMWKSHYGKDESDALKKAARLIADMSYDFYSAFRNKNPMNPKHPKVERWK